MDALDFSLLREMTRDQFVGWGSFDPRVSLASLADRLGVDRTTVRDRLKAWRATGFLRRYAILPNPALFGASHRVCAVRVDNVLAKPRTLRAFQEVPGVLGFIDHVGPWFGAAIIDTDRAALAKLTEAIAGLPSVAEVTPPWGHGPVRPTVEATPLDLRILRVLMDRGDDAPEDLAQAAGVSARTFRRRYERMVEGRAVFSLPCLDFTQYKGAVFAYFQVHCAPGAKARSIARDVAAKAPLSIVGAIAPDDTLPGGESIDLYFHLDSIAEVERMMEVALGADGVHDVEVFYPKRYEFFPDWFRAKLEG